ncbi:MAG: small multi-drug export protein [Clostridiales bacterium]|nr:small multi-drug export protein [Clostridiales bacterium]
MDAIIQSFITFFQDKLPAEVTIFLISLMPVLELRGGLIAAKLLNVSLLPAFGICFLGNILPIPFILLFIRKLFALMKNTKTFKPLIEKLEKHSAKNSEKVNKYGAWGLLLLVAIPLPGTGGWTGALVSALMELPIRKSFPIIAVGVLIAGIIVASLSYGLLGALGV